MKHCYFCNENILLKDNNTYTTYHCLKCNSDNIYLYDLSYKPEYVYLYYKDYFIFFSLTINYCAVYYKHNQIYVFESIPNITSKNIESKLNAILAFL